MAHRQQVPRHQLSSSLSACFAHDSLKPHHFLSCSQFFIWNEKKLQFKPWVVLCGISTFICVGFNTLHLLSYHKSFVKRIRVNTLFSPLSQQNFQGTVSSVYPKCIYNEEQPLAFQVSTNRRALFCSSTSTRKAQSSHSKAVTVHYKTTQSSTPLSSKLLLKTFYLTSEKHRRCHSGCASGFGCNTCWGYALIIKMAVPLAAAIS